jgi:hypothetical protein
MLIILGHPEIDAGGIEIDTDTGEIITLPNNRGPEAATGGAVGDIKKAAFLVKHAMEIRDAKFRKATILAACEYFNGRAAAEILRSSGNVIAIF